MTLRGWALSGVLVACAAHAEERGFQFRAVADVGAALRLGASASSTVYAGPMVAFDATVGGRLGVMAFHGGAELQGVWLIGADFPATLRVGPVTGLSVYAARWAVLSLDAPGLDEKTWPAVHRALVGHAAVLEADWHVGGPVRVRHWPDVATRESLAAVVADAWRGDRARVSSGA